MVLGNLGSSSVDNTHGACYYDVGEHSPHMRSFAIALMLVVTISQSVGQSFDEIHFQDRKIIRTARKATINRLVELKNALSLTKKEVRIRGFELKTCDDPPSESGHKILTPVGEFEQIEGCPAPYTYVHKTTDKGSFYELAFFFDLAGNLVHTNISWSLVTY